jgi:hypothetical protein
MSKSPAAENELPPLIPAALDSKMCSHLLQSAEHCFQKSRVDELTETRIRNIVSFESLIVIEFEEKLAVSQSGKAKED